jgi:hypothetical protein
MTVEQAAAKQLFCTLRHQGDIKIIVAFFILVSSTQRVAFIDVSDKRLTGSVELGLIQDHLIKEMPKHRITEIFISAHED